MCNWIDEDNHVLTIRCTKSRKKLGEAGEQLLCQKLALEHWQILCSNFQNGTHSFEIDVIALDPEGFLVFFEVKTRLSLNIDSVFSTLTKAKLQRLKLGARHFCVQNPHIRHRGWRFDLAVVSFFPDKLPGKPKCWLIDQKRHRLAIFPGIG
ncbi:MAG: YraN family protein [Cyanobacteria bacterium TGS_CYA1]|nr:YraN family protein [Cyanobacteria bacterium TGS_CYA1]